MDEVAGPVVAVALVLCAVFVPCAFISGITGRFFRQFAVTIAVSTVFSALNSLTLSPALAALLLRSSSRRDEPPAEPGSPVTRSAASRTRRDPLTWLLDLALGWFFRLFNKMFGAATAGYGWAVGRLLRVSLLVVLAYGGMLVLTGVVFVRAPTGFVPQQDQGRVFASIQLPDSAALCRTQETVALAEQIALKTPGVAHTITVSGTSFVQQVYASNVGTMFIVLDPFEKRQRPDLSADAIIARLRETWLPKIKDGLVSAYGAPPIPGLSVAGGFKLIVEDRGGLGVDYLQKHTDDLIAKLKRDKSLASVSTVFRSNVPQLYLDIDRKKVASLGVSFDDLNKTLSIYLGSLYVSNFNEFGRYWQVNLQSGGEFRSRLDDIKLLQIRNNQGLMVPLGTLASVREIGGPLFVQRYNLYTAAPVTGGLAPGTGSGTVNREHQRRGRRDAAAFNGRRVDGGHLSANLGGEHHRPGLRNGGAGRVSGTVGPLRKLGATARGYLGGAAVPVMLGGRRAVRESIGGRLRPDRPGRAGGPGMQERHPHRRVRQATASGGQAALRGHGRGVAATAAAHPDDVVRLYFRRFPAHRRHRGRGGDAALPRDRGVRRHVRRDAVRHLSDAGVLLRHCWLWRLARLLHAGYAPRRHRPGALA
jgi:multidrug efflux pump subunit AcrB